MFCYMSFFVFLFILVSFLGLSSFITICFLLKAFWYCFTHSLLFSTLGDNKHIYSRTFMNILPWNYFRRYVFFMSCHGNFPFSSCFSFFSRSSIPVLQVLPEMSTIIIPFLLDLISYRDFVLNAKPLVFMLESISVISALLKFLKTPVVFLLTLF